MEQPKITIKKVFERDMDLLILREFLTDPGFARLFLDKAGLPEGYRVTNASHSLSDRDGESDITLILEYPDRKVALLIEDKIDAPTMPDQSSRYAVRAARAGTEKAYIFLAAPQAYMEKHKDDPNAQYPYTITYEELLEYLKKKPDAGLSRALIECAICNQKAGYQVQEVQAVTAFWNALRAYVEAKYNGDLEMAGTAAPKGADAVWPEFYTALKGVKVIWKSQKGHVDLEFPGYGDHIGDLRPYIHNVDPELCVYPTGRAAAVRISDSRWAVDFHKSFAEALPVVEEVLAAVDRLRRITERLNHRDLY